MVSKYKNKKTVVDGITFDSKKEASRYLELKKLKDAGFIDDLELQVKFVLIPKQEGERECSYIADFVYKNKQTGETIVEDVKSSPRYKTDVYKIKKKLMLFIYLLAGSPFLFTSIIPIFCRFFKADACLFFFNVVFFSTFSTVE